MNELSAVLSLWSTTFQSEFVTASEVVTVVERQSVKATNFTTGNNELRDALRNVAGGVRGVNSRQLGGWLGAHEGRIVGGLRVVRGRLNSGILRWAVVCDAGET